MYMLSFARIVFFVFFCIIGVGDVLAVSVSLPSCDGVTAMTNPTCATYSVMSCYVDNTCRKVQSCTSCPSGQTTITTTYMNKCIYYKCGYPSVVTPGIQPGGGVQHSCSLESCACDKWDWRATGIAGYQSRQTYTCDESTDCKCVYNTEYRCAKGYYGTATSGTSGCTRCPAVNGVSGTTASAGTTSKSGCHIPTTQTMTDSIGTYKFSTQCNAK